MSCCPEVNVAYSPYAGCFARGTRQRRTNHIKQSGCLLDPNGTPKPKEGVPFGRRVGVERRSGKELRRSYSFRTAEKQTEHGRIQSLWFSKSVTDTSDSSNDLGEIASQCRNAQGEAGSDFPKLLTSAQPLLIHAIF